MNSAFPPLYAILSADLLSTPEDEFAAMLAESGVPLIQYRNKTATSRFLLEACSRIVRALKGKNCRFIVNDRADIALLTGADGVHFGQDDLPVEGARAMASARVEPRFLVGVSTHSIEQVREAAKTSADYIAVGPIYATHTKRNPDPVVGLDLIRRARELTDKPLVAIGGVTVETARDVYAAGADCIAIARDLICAPDPAARAAAYLIAAEQNRRECR